MYVDAPASTDVDVSSNVTLMRYDCGKVNGCARDATCFAAALCHSTLNALNRNDFLYFTST